MSREWNDYPYMCAESTPLVPTSHAQGRTLRLAIGHCCYCKCRYCSSSNWVQRGIKQTVDLTDTPSSWTTSQHCLRWQDHRLQTDIPWGSLSGAVEGMQLAGRLFHCPCVAGKMIRLHFPVSSKQRSKCHLGGRHPSEVQNSSLSWITIPCSVKFKNFTLFERWWSSRRPPMVILGNVPKWRHYKICRFCIPPPPYH